MTSGGLPRFVGPINQGAWFVILTEMPSEQDPVTAYFLNIKPNNEYFWDIVTSDEQLSTMPVFGVTRDVNSGGATGNFQDFFFLEDNVGNTATVNNNNLLIAGIQGSPFRIFQSTYQQWDPPTFFLSNIKYSIYDNKSNLVNIRLDDNNVIPADNLIFIPVTWYYGCTANTHNTVATPALSAGYWTCMLNKDLSYCSDGHFPTVPASGFSVIKDCVDTLVYSYCPTGDYCGNGNCNGMCQARDDDCVFKDNAFICKFDPNKYFKDEKWWETTWFKVLVLCIIVSIVVIVIIAVIIGTREHEKHKESEEKLEATEATNKLLTPVLMQGPI